ERSLVAIRYSNDGRFQCDDRFPASHVALQEPDHRISGLAVIHDFFQDAFLCRRRMERKNRLHLLPDALGGLEPHAGESAALRATERENELEKEEFFKDQPAVIWRLSLIQPREIVLLLGKMHALEAGPQLRKCVG